MRIDLYTIEALTNLHVGSGDINFDIVDNQVQRDAISELPNINSSSLKGAFREFFENKEDTNGLVKYIFGPDNKSDEVQQGAFSFFEAQLLTRPVRSNEKAYFNATSIKVIENFLEAIENFGIDFDEELKKELEKLSEIEVKNNPIIFEKIDGVVILEDSEAEYKNFDISEKLEKFLGKDLALFNDKDFKELSLPVIARNNLENGVSKNLWYEEVVPKKSKFYFFIGKPENIADKKKIEGFENRFNKEGEKLQIGANKSIGYGFTKIKKVSK